MKALRLRPWQHRRRRATDPAQAISLAQLDSRIHGLTRLVLTPTLLRLSQTASRL